MKTIIAEKEEAGRRLAEILIPNFEEQSLYNITFFKGNDTVIIPARGHIVQSSIRELRRVKTLEELPKTSIVWKVDKANKNRMTVFNEFLKKSEEYIVATDWDREGEVIGYNIVRYCLGVDEPQKIERAYFSSLTEREVKEAFSNIKSMNEALLTQGLARNIADLIIGLNLTKALTLIFKTKHNQLGQAITLGRVQSPLLGYVKETVTSQMSGKERVWNSSYEVITHFIDLGDRQPVINLSKTPSSDWIEISEIYETSSFEPQAEKLYNTDDVMSESRIKPETTMRIMENLYLKGYLTYPRTTSRYVRHVDFLAEIENTIRKYYDLPQSFSYKNTPVEPIEEAHPDAILLTPEGIDAYYTGKIKGRERFIATIVLTRTIRSFAPPLKKKSTIVKVKYETSEGITEEEIEWSRKYENLDEAIKYVSDDFSEIPKIGKYKLGTLKEIKNKRYNFGSFTLNVRTLTDVDMVRWMSQVGIGTEATRQIFPELLKDKKHHYLDDSNLPTLLGETVADIITNKLKISYELTAQMEAKINKLQKLNELNSFIQEISKDTQLMIQNLKNIQPPDFTCPEGHNATLVNRLNKETHENILLLWCDTCKKYYGV
jgi:DNA topoisomerase-1